MLTVSNVGGSPLEFFDVSLEGGTSPFSIDFDGAPLAAGADRDLGVTFRPTSPGRITDRLRVQTNAVTAPLVTIDIEGESTAAPGTPFRRGDVSADGSTDLSDAVMALNFLFLGGPAPPCLAAAELNLNAEVEIGDPIYLLNHLFLGGPAPPAPYPDCGVSENDLPHCESFPPCAG